MKTTVQLPSSDGRSTLHGLLWYDSTRQPLALVQLVHGMCEYVERYEPFAQELVSQGYAVFGMDHIGHGHSVSQLEDLGYFGPEGSWRFLVEDVHRAADWMAARFPGTPRFLLGHSMGSFISRLYLTRYGRTLAGAILSGTGGPNAATNAGLNLARLTQLVHGERYRSPLLDKMAFGSYNRRILVPRTRYDWLTRDTHIVDRYASDPLCAFCFTTGGFRELLTMVGMVSTSEWPKLVPQNLPILLLSGLEDPVGDYGVGVRTVADRLRKAGVDDLSLRLYPNGRHEMLNEWNRTEVYRDVCSWLHAHLPEVNCSHSHQEFAAAVPI